MRSILPLLILGSVGPVVLGQSTFQLVHDGSIPVTRAGQALQMPWAGGMNWCHFSSIDLNGDGVKDIFAFDRSGNEAIALIHEGGPGSMQYRYDPVISATWPFNMLDSWALMRDFDCDGREDLFAYATGQGGFAVYRNISDANGPAFELYKPLVGSNYVPTFSPNLYVTQVDLPAIDDIDGDGDLDVLTFSIFGNFVEYHKNLSMEEFGTCDSLKYEVRNRCWGAFSENILNNSVTLNDPCSFNVPNPEFPLEPGILTGPIRSDGDVDLASMDRSAAHAGSTLLSIDLNGDGVKDLMLGDISYNNLVALTNGGSISNALMVSVDDQFPSYDTPTNLPVYPGACYVDIDQDGKRDLVVGPNANSLAENTRSVWYYRNVGTDASPLFDYQMDDLFQREMLDFGEGAYPVFFDHNGDGLMDLVVSNYGYYTGGGTYPSKVALLENTGTAQSPAFTLLSDDWQGLSGSGIGTAMVPTFGDLDGDGDQDMIVGDLQGRLHFFRNTASGPLASFTLETPNVTDALGNVIDVGQFASPQLFDVNGDQLLDLLVGERNGNINFYQNTGNAQAPSWQLIADTLGGVVVAEWWNVTGFSVPCMFLNANGERELLVGSESSWIHHYGNIDNNLGGTFTLLDSTFQGIREGTRSSVSVFDLDGDGDLDVVTGNYRGGLGFWRNDRIASVIGYDRPAARLVVTPNPTDGIIHIQLPHGQAPGLRFSIHNTTGQRVMEGILLQERAMVDLSSLGRGLYHVHAEGPEGRWSAKVLLAP